MRSSLRNASFFFTRAGAIRTETAAAIWAAAGGAAPAPPYLPAYLKGLLGLIGEGGSTSATAIAIATKLSPSNAPFDGPMSTTLAIASEAYGSGPNDTFRAWVTTNAAGGPVTLPTPFPGDPATANLQDLVAWVSSAV